jgi:hypothetical protein
MSATNPIKISVLAGGEVLLDGQPIAIEGLDEALRRGAEQKAVVWYYRENGSGEPPAIVEQVMKLIVSHRLPVRLSTQPDFSDTVKPAAPDWEKAFESVREQAARGSIAIVRPDGRLLLLAAQAKANASPEMLAAIERMLPSTVKRNVAVIADTAWTMQGAPDLRTAGEAIPFLGTLIGFSTIGHAVWIFQFAVEPALVAGCRNADVLIADSRSVERLPASWQEAVRKAMRHPQILVHDFASSKLQKL